MPRRFWALLFLGFLSFFVFLHNLCNGFVWDDNLYITNNSALQSDQGVWSFFKQGFCEEVEKPCDFYRPLVSISYFIDYFLWGPNPLGYHLINIIFHLLVVFGVYGTAVKLVESLPGHRTDSPTFLWMPFFSSLIFALHPAHVESVAFIAARTDPPTALWMLGSFWFFMSFRNVGGAQKGIAYGFSLIFLILALFTKEMAVTLPLLLLVYDYLFVFKTMKALGSRVFQHVPFFLALPVFLIIRKGVLGEGLNFQWDTFLDRLFHLPVLWFGYLKLMIIPYPLQLFHSLPSIIEHPILHGVLPGTAFLIILYLMVRWRTSQPLMVFSVTWFFVTLLPVLNIVPISYPTVTERFSYIPSIGFCFFTGGAISWVFLRNTVKGAGMRQSWFFILLGLVLAGFVGIIFDRTKDWRSDINLWKEEVKRSPDMYLSHFNYGVLLDSLGHFQEASTHYEKAISLNPKYIPSFLNLAFDHERMDNLDEAEQIYQKVIRFDPRLARVHYKLGNVYIKKKEFDLARIELETALKLKPDFSQAHNNLGFIFQSLNDTEAAYGAFLEAVRSDPNNGEAHQNLGIVLKIRGDYLKAEKELLNALEINPTLVSALRSLGFLYFDKLNQKEKALFHFLQVRDLFLEPDEEVEKAIETIQDSFPSS
jgi:tetratricopeptide (TPR) repeat protein